MGKRRPWYARSSVDSIPRTALYARLFHLPRFFHLLFTCCFCPFRLEQSLGSVILLLFPAVSIPSVLQSYTTLLPVTLIRVIHHDDQSCIRTSHNIILHSNCFHAVPSGTAPPELCRVASCRQLKMKKSRTTTRAGQFQ